MAKLTDGKSGSIAKATPPANGQRFIFDDHRDAPRGFGLRITATGSKAFILKYTFDGKQYRKTIGVWPTWSLGAARTEAASLKQKIDSGTDPRQETRQRKQEPTVNEAVKLYVASHVVGLASEKAIKGYFERDLVPALGKIKIREVTRRDLIELIETKAAKTPTAARHLLTYTKGLFNWCVDREYLIASPASGLRRNAIRAKGQKNVLKPKPRKRVLDPSEIQAFWINIEISEIQLLTTLALKLVLLTGQRPGEVAGMKKSEINGDIWIIPPERRGKTETEQRVPLTTEAQKMIARAQEEVSRLSKRRKREPTEYVFETGKGEPISVGALSKAVKRYSEHLKNKNAPTLGHWKPHDLRRTARTGMAACGFTKDIAERVIGHAAGGMEDVYNQHDYDTEKRAALEAWERRLMAIVAGKSPDSTKILPFTRVQVNHS